MPIENRISAPQRRAPRANRAPVNEYAGLGQGLQQLAQGLDNLTTTQWRLQVSNESASLDNWLTEQMGTLQIEALKKHRDPDEQLLHWQNGVKELEKDAVQMYGEDELMQNRWQNIFENKRIPGELQMQAKTIRTAMDRRKGEAFYSLKGIERKVLSGEITYKFGRAQTHAIYDGLKVDGLVGHYEEIERRLASKQSLQLAWALRNPAQTLGAFATKNNGVIPRSIGNAATIDRLGVAAAEAWAKQFSLADPRQQGQLARALVGLSGDKPEKIEGFFQGKDNRELFEKAMLLVNLGPNAEPSVLDAADRPYDKILISPAQRNQLNGATSLIATKVGEIAHALPQNASSRREIGELRGRVKITAALLLERGKSRDTSEALEAAINSLFPYEVRQRITVPLNRGWTDKQKNDFVDFAADKRLKHINQQADNKRTGLLIDPVATEALQSAINVKPYKDGFALFLRGRNGDDALIEHTEFTYAPNQSST